MSLTRLSLPDSIYYNKANKPSNITKPTTLLRSIPIYTLTTSKPSPNKK